jgi:hypothetical protein
MPIQLAPRQKPALAVNGFWGGAIAHQSFACNAAIRVARAAPWQYRHHGAPAEAVDEALGIVFDHCFEAARAGQSPRDMLQALGVNVSPLTSWGDAIARLAATWLVEVWPKLPHQSRGPP